MLVSSIFSIVVSVITIVAGTIVLLALRWMRARHRRRTLAKYRQSLYKARGLRARRYSPILAALNRIIVEMDLGMLPVTAAWSDAIGVDHGLHRRSKAIARVVGEVSRPGSLAFRTPNPMRQGDSERISVGIARTTVDAVRLAQLIKVEPDGVEDVQTSDLMEVDLVGEAFAVQALSPARQIVAPTAVWHFNVVPLKPGLHVLTTVGKCWMRLPELGDQPISLPAFDRVVLIRVSYAYGARRVVAAHWQWLVGTAVAVAAAVGGWVALFR
jgi:hypothetical protein